MPFKGIVALALTVFISIAFSAQPASAEFDDPNWFQDFGLNANSSVEQIFTTFGRGIKSIWTVVEHKGAMANFRMGLEKILSPEKVQALSVDELHHIFNTHVKPNPGNPLILAAWFQLPQSLKFPGFTTSVLRNPDELVEEGTRVTSGEIAIVAGAFIRDFSDHPEWITRIIQICSDGYINDNRWTKAQMLRHVFSRSVVLRNPSAVDALLKLPPRQLRAQALPGITQHILLQPEVITRPDYAALVENFFRALGVPAMERSQLSESAITEGGELTFPSIAKEEAVVPLLLNAEVMKKPEWKTWFDLAKEDADLEKAIRNSSFANLALSETFPDMARTMNANPNIPDMNLVAMATSQVRREDWEQVVEDMIVLRILESPREKRSLASDFLFEVLTEMPRSYAHPEWVVAALTPFASYRFTSSGASLGIGDLDQRDFERIERMLALPIWRKHENLKKFLKIEEVTIDTVLAAITLWWDSQMGLTAEEILANIKIGLSLPNAPHPATSHDTKNSPQTDIAIDLRDPSQFYRIRTARVFPGWSVQDKTIFAIQIGTEAFDFAANDEGVVVKFNRSLSGEFRALWRSYIMALAEYSALMSSDPNREKLDRHLELQNTIDEIEAKLIENLSPKSKAAFNICDAFLGGKKPDPKTP